MKTEDVSVAKLSAMAAPYNPRRISTHDLAALRRSLRTFGTVEPVVVNRRSGRIVGGHQRVKAAEAEGIESLPVFYVDLDDAGEKTLNLALNRISGEFDEEKLSALLEELHLADVDLTLTGFDDRELTKLIASLTKSDIDAEPQMGRASELRDEWKTERGQLWQLGDHRLACGDSTNLADVGRLMAGEKAVLFATDPPYLVDYDGTNHPGTKKSQDRPSLNKNWSESYRDFDRSEEGDELYDSFVSVAIQAAIRGNAAWYMWHASRRQAMVEAVWERHGAFVHQTVIWAKDRGVLTRSWFLWAHEPCFMGWVKGQKPPKGKAAQPLSTIWNLPSTSRSEDLDHPTVKPVECFEYPMWQHTNEGDLCYEPFSGSGTQIIAAERTGRRCFAMEIAPEFVAVALQRYLDATGKTPVLLEPAPGAEAQ
jgi:DNA modification methylase